MSKIFVLDTRKRPRTKAKQFKRVHGFMSGDMVKAVVPTGKKAGTYIGRVAVRTSGSFNIKTENGTVQGISYRHCRLFQRADGYMYEGGATCSSRKRLWIPFLRGRGYRRLFSMKVESHYNETL